MLLAENLHYRANGRLLLPPTSLAAGAGGFVKVVGGNGAGKTTLLKILCRLLPFGDGGRLQWDGSDADADADDYRESFLYIGHKNALAADLSPLENLRGAALLRRRPPLMTAAEALERAGLAAEGGRQCRFLSAGQRRRAALARLQMFAARLWILDEPLAALDAAGREMLGGWLAAHLAAGGAAVATMHAAEDWTAAAAAQVVHCGGAE